MKHISRILVACAVAAFAFASCEKPSKDLVVATYDSFVADYGPGPQLAKLFKDKTGITITWKSKGDGGQLLADLILSGEKPDADVAVGLDNFLAPKALSMGLFEPFSPKNLASVPADLRIDPSNRLQPYDFGYFAIIYDSQKAKELPTSLEDFTKPAFAKKLILMDPRSSTPGLGFLAWTKAVYGDNWMDYWKRLEPSILTMTPGWDAGYGLFTSGEAPFVLSYTTSPAYHVEVEKTDRYKVLPLSDGGIREVELAGVLKGAAHRSNAELFLDFLLSKDAQALLPTTQWMYPANKDVTLPASYSAATPPAKLLSVSSDGLIADAAKLMGGFAVSQ